MSNCIEIRNYLVTFPKEEIDYEKFLQLVKEHESHPRTFREMKVEDTFCWYIRDNCEVTPFTESVSIKFGKGASSHTWRDFAATVNLLQPLIKKERRHFFSIADEMDDFKSFGDYLVVFGKKYDKYLNEVKESKEEE